MQEGTALVGNRSWKEIYRVFDRSISKGVVHLSELQTAAAPQKSFRADPGEDIVIFLPAEHIFPLHPGGICPVGIHLGETTEDYTRLERKMQQRTSRCCGVSHPPQSGETLQVGAGSQTDCERLETAGIGSVCPIFFLQLGSPKVRKNNR